MFETVLSWLEDGWESYVETYPFETYEEAHDKLHELENEYKGEDVLLYIQKRGSWYNV
jgi:hypothetical protein